MHISWGENWWHCARLTPDEFEPQNFMVSLKVILTSQNVILISNNQILLLVVCSSSRILILLSDFLSYVRQKVSERIGQLDTVTAWSQLREEKKVSVPNTVRSGPVQSSRLSLSLSPDQPVGRSRWFEEAGSRDARASRRSSCSYFTPLTPPLWIVLLWNFFCLVYFLLLLPAFSCSWCMAAS